MHTAGFGHAKATTITTTVAAAAATTTTARAICNYIKIRQKRWKKNEQKKLLTLQKQLCECVCVCECVWSVVLI